MLLLIINVYLGSTCLFGCAVDNSFLGTIRPVFFYDCGGVSSTVYSEDVFNSKNIYNENKKNMIVMEWQRYFGDKKISSGIKGILFPAKDYNNFGRLKNTEYKFTTGDFADELNSGDGPYAKEYLDYIVYNGSKNNGMETPVIKTKNAGFFERIKKFFSGVEIKAKPIKTELIAGAIKLMPPDKIGLNEMKARAINKGMPDFLRRKWAYLAIKEYYNDKGYKGAISLYDDVFSGVETYDIARIYSMEYYGYSLFESGDRAGSLSVLLEMTGRMSDVTADNYFMEVWANNYKKEDFEDYRKKQADRHKIADSYYVQDKLDCIPLIKYEPESVRTMAAIVNNLRTIYSEKLMGSAERLSFDIAGSIKAEMLKAISEGKELYNKPLWYLAAAYLCVLTEDKQAEDLVKKAQGLIAAGSMLDLQSDAVKFLIAYNKERSFSAATESLLVKIIKEYSISDRWRMDDMFKVKDSILFISAHKYFENRDFVRSAACFYKSSVSQYGLFLLDMCVDNKPMLESLARGSGPFDSVLKEIPFGNTDDLLYIAAMKSMRKKDFNSAEAYALQISPQWWDDTAVCDYWSEQKGIKCIHYYYGRTDHVIKHAGLYEDDFLRGSFISLSKKDIISEVKRLAGTGSMSSDKEKAAKADYRLANIYMSCPYLSYSDTVWAGWMWQGIHYYLGVDTWMINKIIPPQKKIQLVRTFYDEEYNNAKIANNYFIKALSLTKNRELMAKCEMGRILTARKIRREGVGSYDEFNWYGEKKIIEQKSADWQTREKEEAKSNDKELQEFIDGYGKTEFYKLYSHSCSSISEAEINKKQAERLKELN